MTIGNRTYAAEILADLEYLELYFPTVTEEVRRVLNVGIPLAEVVRAGQALATGEGRLTLVGTAATLQAVRRVLGNEPAYAKQLPVVNDQGEAVLSWIPLFDAVREAESR